MGVFNGTMTVRRYLVEGEVPDDFRDRFTEQRNEDAWLRHLFGQWRRHSAELGFETPDFDSFWAKGWWEAEAPKRGAEYTQFAEFHVDPEENPLDTPSGIMHGSYHMVVPDTGEAFDVGIPAFSLDSPHQEIRVH